MSEPTNLLWYSSVAVQLLFCVHLLWTRLFRRYPVFTLYLGCAGLRSLIACYLTAGYSGALPLSYTYFWMWSEPVLIMLQVAVALEVHAGMWKEHASIARPARPILFFGLLTAILIAAIPLKLELSRFSTIHLEAILQFEFLAKRYISTVLALFLVFSALLFLVVIRNSLKSSLLRHESMLALYLGIYAIAYFAVDMGWAKARWMSNYLLAAVTICLVVWISVLRPGRELVGQ